VPDHVVLLPVKPPASGKSRLSDLTDAQRRALAGAFALDTAVACLTASRVARVLVTTDDTAFAGRLGDLGCETVPDGDTRGLNAVLRQAAAEAARRWPDLRPVALCADLPALRSGDLDDALATVDALPPDAAAFVSDAEGTGTTLYSAPSVAFDPRFGFRSRAAHVDAGVRELAGGWPTLRHDVDDTDGLRAAVGLGVGAATARVLTGLRLD